MQLVSLPYCKGFMRHRDTHWLCRVSRSLCFCAENYVLSPQWINPRADTIIWSTGCTFLNGFSFRVSMQPASVKPGNVQTNWAGMTSYQADYCHSSSGNGGSTGDQLCLTCSTWLRVGGVGGLQCLLAGAFLGSASEQGRISHHCQKFGGSPHICSVWKMPDFESLAIETVVGMCFVCTCQKVVDRAGS